jgi:cell division protein FtsQ
MPVKSKQKPKRTLKQSQQSSISFVEALDLLQRGLWFVVICFFIGGLGAWIFILDGLPKTGQWIQHRLIDHSVGMGLNIQSLTIEGRKHTDREAIRKALHIERGDPMLAFSPKTTKNQLESLNWVKEAHIFRQFPDRIHIELVEYEPASLWMHDQQLDLIAENGRVLQKGGDLSAFRTLPMISGEHGEAHVQELYDLLNNQPFIRPLLETAQWVGNRRWDFYLNNGVKIILPEIDEQMALARLEKAHKENKILERPLKIIDLKDPQNIVVETLSKTPIHSKD